MGINKRKLMDFLYIATLFVLAGVFVWGYAGIHTKVLEAVGRVVVGLYLLWMGAFIVLSFVYDPWQARRAKRR